MNLLLTFSFKDNYQWSSKQIIAASSDKKVCLYHPMNGFTRALDIFDRVCLTFSNNGDYLAMAYRKSKRTYFSHDLYIFKIDHDILFNSEKLETEKIRSELDYDITAMCYTKNDNYLMCGTEAGEIFVLECSMKRLQKDDPSCLRWNIHKRLPIQHKHEIRKICFSATHCYMATLDVKGEFKIWNGGSWTYIFSYQKEESRLYKHFEWHPYVENELIFGREYFPALYLFNVTQKKIVAGFMSWKEDWELTSIAFNPVTAQLAVCFYNEGNNLAFYLSRLWQFIFITFSPLFNLTLEEYINRVSLLASMSQVISTFDFDYVEEGLKLFWNNTGTMLGAGAQTFRFAFWSFNKSRDYNMQMSCFNNNDGNNSSISNLKNNNNKSKKTSKLPSLSDSKLSVIR